MRLSILFVCVLAAVGLQAQPTGRGADPNVSTTVRIPKIVKVVETRLPPGTYDLRLTGEHPASPGREERPAQEWVEFVSNGKVVARELAEIWYEHDLPTVGASSQKARTGSRVEMLKDGEFLRISIKRENARYLIYLPVSAG